MARTVVGLRFKVRKPLKAIDIEEYCNKYLNEEKLYQMKDITLIKKENGYSFFAINRYIPTPTVVIKDNKIMKTYTSIHHLEFFNNLLYETAGSQAILNRPIYPIVNTDKILEVTNIDSSISGISNPNKEYIIEAEDCYFNDTIVIDKKNVRAETPIQTDRYDKNYFGPYGIFTRFCKNGSYIKILKTKYSQYNGFYEEKRYFIRSFYCNKNHKVLLSDCFEIEKYELHERYEKDLVQKAFDRLKNKKRETI